MEESSCEFDIAAAQEMVNFEKQAERPSWATHAMPTEASDAIQHIKVGSFYEIDHSKLTPQTPDQLKSIRVVMVSEKTQLQVAVRFPSTFSLRTHFSNGNCGRPEGKQLPALNEKHIMDSDLAGDALYRRIPAQEIAEKGNSWNFWGVPPVTAEKDSGPALRTRLRNEVSRKGSCWSELKLTGIVQWGKRRQVRFLGGQEEQKVETLSTKVRDEEQRRGRQEEEGDDDEVEEVEGEAVKVVSSMTKKNLKRKCHGSSRAQKPKKATHEKQYQIQVYNQSKRKKLKDSIERWSVERYKLAEENMLKILKAKGAVFGNPILRPALRTEARKLIGDTGLLDHLLKHMAGKVAPGGTERFRRRHNAEGAMEYWLESAELVNVRKEAGVQDSYWTPPPGWKPGDNPSQDPVCARELRALKEEIAKMKKDMQELVTKEQEENLAIVTTPNSSVMSLNWNFEGSLIPLKETYIDLMKRKAKMGKQLAEISLALSGMEVQLGMLKSAVEEPIVSESEAPPPLLMGSPTTPSDCTERETKESEQKNKSASKSSEEREEDKGGDKAAVIATEDKGRDEAAVRATEDKAAKIERLKSGFRICKPRGTFLWPNMLAMSPQSVVHLEDLLTIPTPTPPSASSTTSVTHFQLPPCQTQLGPHPASPVKPLAERLLSNAILKSVTKPSLSPSPPPPPETPYSTIKSCSVINLNEPPQIQHTDTGFCGTITYQRRQHCVTSDASMPHLVLAKKEGTENMDLTRNCDEQQQTPSGCSSSTINSSSSSWLQSGEGWWLALATSNPSLDMSNRG
ncbi:protein DYAD [Juglans regia]|uniref:Protein DYAD n=1 Tax=Juglans regia TaxID=51240 RepID=A0A2I4E8U8_JUGRE|nr:protein DYAD [Juglans regia]